MKFNDKKKETKIIRPAESSLQVSKMHFEVSMGTILKALKDGQLTHNGIRITAFMVSEKPVQPFGSSCYYMSEFGNTFTLANISELEFKSPEELNEEVKQNLKAKIENLKKTIEFSARDIETLSAQLAKI